MSDKTLVERLIEAKPANCADFARIFGIECLEQSDCVTCKRIVCYSIANAIEGEYIPRPRYEDGEPVQFGDTYTDKNGREWKNGIKSIHIDCNGDFSLHDSTIGHVGRYEVFGQDRRVKRHKPEVLDADGVPIQIGDTMWNINTGKYLIVDGIGERWFCAKRDIVKHNPSMFSHKQPDSLERIKADASKSLYEYWGCSGVSCLDCPAKTDGKKPRERYGTYRCNKAMTLDLLRRQREVMERDHEC